MRKFLLSAATFLFSVGSMMATVLPEMATVAGDNIKMNGSITKRAKAADANVTPRWDLSYITDGSVTAVSFQSAGTYKAAIVIPEDIAKQCIGSKLTDIFFLMGTSKDTAGKVFVTKGLTGETLWEKDITLNLGTLSGNNLTFGENEVVLDEPYVFTGEEIAVGFQFKCPRSNGFTNYYPFAIGNESAINEYCDNAALVNGDGDEWAHIGSPVAMVVGVEGENLPTWVATAGYQFPFVVKPGEKADVIMQFFNLGGTRVTSVSTESKVDGADLVAEDHNVSVSPGTIGQVSFETAVLDKEGIYNVEAQITKANDMAVEPVTVDGYVKSIDKGTKRRILVEEWTGTWCGWCPIGIWGMDEMNKNYPDDFVGIAIHGDDDMEDYEYITSLARRGYASNFPGALVDRMAQVQPSPDNLKLAVELLGGNRGFGDISIEAKYVDEKETMLQIDGSAKITYDPAEVNPLLASSKYRVAFVITENKVPGVQNNNFAGGRNGKCGGWENKRSSVSWEYSDVARKIDTFDGIEGLLPDVMEKDKEYTFSHNIKLPSAVKVGSNIDIVAILINGTTGYVENAVKIAGPLRAASIDDIAADGASSVKVIGGNGVVEIAGDCVSAEIYGINGVRVASVSEAQSVPVAAGLYIVRTVAADGSVTTAKVSVR